MTRALTNRLTCLIAAGFVAMAQTALSPAAAQDAQRAQELEQIERRLKQRAREEARLVVEAEEREKEVAALRYRMIETADSLQEAEQRISEISRDIETLTGEEATLATSLAAEQANLGDVLGALLALEQSQPPTLLVTPDDANAAARAAMLLADAAPALKERAAEIRTALDQLASVRADLDLEKKRFEKTNDEIGARRTVLSELLLRKQEESDVAARLAAAAQSETAALAARATNLRDVLRRLEKLARSIAPRLKPAPPRRGPAASPPSTKPRSTADRRGGSRGEIFKPSRPFAEARGALRAPVVGRLIGEFGKSRPEGGRFDGIRLLASDKAIVTAPYEANVAFARSWNPIGNLIVLDVGNGYHILIMGVGAFLVEEGQGVSAGEPLGTMVGDNASLDLEIRKNGEPVNPELWLSRKTMEETAY